mgnify:CR=1 FL=1
MKQYTNGKSYFWHNNVNSKIYINSLLKKSIRNDNKKLVKKTNRHMYGCFFVIFV